jgi:hypothetical protein
VTRWRRARRGGVTAVVLAALVVSSMGAGRAARPVVIVYGDSLVWESAREIRAWSAARGYDAVVRWRFGGAPCASFDQMRADRALRPKAVIIAFVGSTHQYNPCVGTDVDASYRAQIRTWKEIWTGTGVRLLWAAVPLIRIDWVEAVQVSMSDEATRLGIRVVDGGKYVSPGRVWYWTQPCMPGERCVGSQISRLVPPGRNIVRSSDRTHFCPGPPHGLDPCRYYSSGSWRYARALTEGLTA